MSKKKFLVLGGGLGFVGGGGRSADFGKIPACLLHLDRDQLGQLDWLKLRQLA